MLAQASLQKPSSSITENGYESLIIMSTRVSSMSFCLAENKITNPPLHFHQMYAHQLLAGVWSVSDTTLRCYIRCWSQTIHLTILFSMFSNNRPWSFYSTHFTIYPEVSTDHRSVQTQLIHLSFINMHNKPDPKSIKTIVQTGLLVHFDISTL